MIDKRPSFQFYPQDFLSDQNVIAMNPEQRGIYITLLSICWIQGKIPSDSKAIAKLCGGYSITMADLDFVIATFKRHPKKKGFLVHPRLDLERAKQDANRIKREKSGKAGAEKRWHGKGLNGKAIAKDGLSSSSSSSSSSSTSVKPKTIYGEKYFEEDWQAYPRKEGNKKNARRDYLKTVTSELKRIEILNKMGQYVNSIEDKKFLMYGATFFHQWEDLEIAQEKSWADKKREERGLVF
jgi:uncharacterized protein YdaU (DUF1376 family)